VSECDPVMQGEGGSDESASGGVGTGNVGRHALVGIDARPDLELVGVWVSSEAKAGRDAGELAGLDRKLGWRQRNDVDAILALAPDCIVHTAWPTTG